MTELTPKDRLEIDALDASYVAAFDAGDAEAYVACFAGEGRFVMPNRINLVGQLAEFADDPTRRTFHQVTGRRFEGSMRGARGWARVLALRVPTQGAVRLVELGEYEDEFTVEDDRWVFASRTFHSWLQLGQAGGALGFAPVG